MLVTAMLAGALAAATCEGLTSQSAQDITITAAEVVPAGASEAAPGRGGARGRGQGAAAPAPRGRGERGAGSLPEYCRVAAVLRPSRDSNIKMELWMPTTTWNGKFQAVGNGGWAGAISFSAMQSALAAGYATASTDTGHESATNGSAAFAVGHPEKVTDFAWRAVHEMTAKSKALIAAFYEKPARLSYFNGCSTGGRQGLMSAQRFPEDFDAIVSGAPVYNQIHLSASQLIRQVEVIRDPARRLTPDKITLLARSVVAACDADDGVTDGIVGRPDRCSFSPAAIACKAGDAPDCLTAPQVETAQRAYQAVKTRSGATVYPGSSRGFEAGIRMPDAPMELHYSTFRDIGRQDSKWDPMSFDLDADLAIALKSAPALEAGDPNLARFKARGGKLLLYHGWADPGPAPANTIAYVEAVEKTLGGKQDDWMRLFLMPGVGHCSGGVGPDRADFIGALDRWREGGQAPLRIEASKVTNGAVEMSRPLCPHPQVAVHNGKGGANDAGSFTCRNP